MPKRRANGEGGIPCVRKDGRWQAHYTAYDKTGERILKTVMGRSQTECAKKIQDIVHQINTGVYVAPEKVTFKTWVMDWFKLYGEPRWNSQQTRKTHLQNIEKHLIPAFGRVRLQKLEPPRIQSFFNQLSKDGKKSATVRKIMEPMTGCLKKAAQLNMINSNPCDKVELPPLRQEEVKHLDHDEVEIVLGEFPDSTHGRICEFILHTGLRAAEIAGLQWADVDFKNRLIHIKRTAHYQKLVENGVKAEHQSLVIAPTKTTNSDRDVPLNDDAVELLKVQLVVQRHENQNKRWKGGLPGAKLMWVFASKVGTCIQMDNTVRVLEQMLKGMEVKRVTVHPLRHSCFTEMNYSGVDPRTISEIAGHKKVSFTLQVYVHSNIETKRGAVQKLQELNRHRKIM
ncbi:site-specific integrase [Clostridia bacterium]|nr:site-specific integrase [Clostridia bacterium]